MHPFHRTLLAALLPALLLSALSSPAPARAAEPRVALQFHAAQTPSLSSARLLGRLATSTPLHLALTLPLRNQAALNNLLRRQYTPGDPLYGHFLTSDEFVAQFGPTEADYSAVAEWAKSQGLAVTGTHASRTVLDVAGSASQVESAFGTRLNQYRLLDGRVVFANSAAPTAPRSISARVTGIVGLSNLSLMRPNFSLMRSGAHRASGAPSISPRVTGIGSGPAGGLTPNDVKFAYSLSTVTPLYGYTGTVVPTTTTLLDGKGQTIGLFELDGYNPADIALFVNQFSLPTVLDASATTTTLAKTGVVIPVLVDGYSGAIVDAVNGQPEVTLDIDMILALAPNATHVYSYEGTQGATKTNAAGNTKVAVDIFQKMADDQAADGSGKPLLQVISCSWDIAEEDEDPAIRNAENTIFQKMAAQGQSVFCNSGDYAAFSRYPTTLTLEPSVSNPASQPFVTAVGGTTLSYTKPSTSTAGVAIPGSYGGEVVWKTGTANNPTGPRGSGGGSSVIWPKPDYQAGLGASPLRRDVPDVALNADPATGYDIYVNAVASTTGGTSASAPLWAAFAALVNEQRGLNGLTTTLGFANPPLYTLARSTAYNTLFHDITVGDNLLYQAQTGYDDATGFGSFIGNQLIAALSANADQGTGTATLNGTVTDGTTGLGVGGVTVTATSASTGTVKATTTTDMTGAYTLTVPSGVALTVAVDTSTITISTTSYAAPAPVSLTLTAGATTTQNFTLTAAHTFAAGLQMISAPYDFSGIGDFATEFGLATPLANPNPRLIQWEPLLSSYVFYPTPPADMLRPGQGYWIKFPNANYLHRLGAAVPTTQSFLITLQAGWNQIGDPFFVSVPVSSLTADTVPSTGAVAITAATSPVQSNLFAYNPATNAYVALDTTSGTLDPYVGYWIFAKQTSVLSISPTGGVPPPPY